MNRNRRIGLGCLAALLILACILLIGYTAVATGRDGDNLLFRVDTPAQDTAPLPAAPVIVEDEVVQEETVTVAIPEVVTETAQEIAETGREAIDTLTAESQDPNVEEEDAPRKWPVGGDAFALSIDVLFVNPSNFSEVYYGENLCDHSFELCKDTGISLSRFGEDNIRDILERANLPAGREYAILMRLRTASNTVNPAWTTLWYFSCGGDVEAMWPHPLEMYMQAGPTGGTCDLYVTRDLALYDPLGETVLNLQDVYNTSLAQAGSTRLGLFFGGGTATVSLMGADGNAVSTVGLTQRDDERLDANLNVVARTQSEFPLNDGTLHHYRIRLFPYAFVNFNVGEIVLEPFGDGEATFIQFAEVPNAPLPRFTAGSE